MSSARRFSVLVATDGSTTAQAAVSTAVRFPWPAHARAFAVVARPLRSSIGKPLLWAALDREADLVAQRAARALSRRWSDSEARVVDATPVAGIVAEARRMRADVVVVGWRGHGAWQRLIAGSVSRGVARKAPCSVLVVRATRPAFRRVVLGVDGSPHAARAVALLATLAPPRGGRVTLLQAVDIMPVPRQSLATAAIRASVATEVARINTARRQSARRNLEKAAATLAEAGWKVDAVVSDGAPLRTLLTTVDRTRADVLVVGARGVTGLRHLLLGSVAEGAWHASPVPVLIAR